MTDQKIEPRCPYFGACGGCTVQDIPYEIQLENKREVLREATGIQDIRVLAGEPWFYRNRMDFVFHRDGLGFRRRGSWQEMVDVDRCPISRQPLNLLLEEVREAFAGVFYFDVRRRFGTYCYAVIRTPGDDSSVSIVLNQKSKKLDEAVQRIEAFASHTSAANVLVTFIPHNRNVSVSEDYRVIKGRDILAESYLERSFLFPAQGFFQVNREVAEKVHTVCGEILSNYPTRGARLLDLYGGVGTFGLMNASRFQEVTILENYPRAVEAARLNVRDQDAENVRVVSLDARRLREIEMEPPFFIILDPPRSGMHPKTLKRLNELNPEALLYISCNPRHLAADLKILDTYHVRGVTLFDMFPQTPHLEAMVELVKSPRGV